MCCFYWTHRERFHPRFLLRHRDQFYWWLPCNPAPSELQTALFLMQSVGWPELHTPVAQLLQGKLPVSPGGWTSACWGKMAKNHLFQWCFCNFQWLFDSSRAALGEKRQSRDVGGKWGVVTGGTWPRWCSLGSKQRQDGVTTDKSSW